MKKTLLIFTAIITFFLVSFFIYKPISIAVMKIVYNLRWTDGLVGYWSFNGRDMDWASSTAEALDASGQGNHGNVINFGQEAARPGMVGQALSFDGVNDYINFGSKAVFDVADFTISAWVYIDSAKNTDEKRVFSRDDILTEGPDGREIYNLKTSSPFACGGVSGKPAFEILAGGLLSSVCSPSALTPGWHHLAGVRSGTTISLYVDGALVANTTTSIVGTISPEAPLILGQVSPTYNGEFFAGIIDEARFYNRALSAAEIAFQYERTAPTGRSPTKSVNRSGLVGYWNFDACDSCTNVKDMSGNGNDGTISDANNSGLKNRVAGKINNALNFDGVDDYVDIADNPSLKFGTGNFSVSAWFKTNTTVRRTIVNKFDYAGDGVIEQGFLVDVLASGVVRFVIETNKSTVNNYRYIDGNTAVNNNVWHHVVAVRDGQNSIKLYIDGKEENGTLNSSGTVTTIDTATSFQIAGESDRGSGQFPFSLDFNGLIDEVRLYNRALSVDEIKNLFEETRRIYVNMPQNDKFTSGLVGMWSFNGRDVDLNQTSAEIRDASPNAVHGDLMTGDRFSFVPGIVGQALDFSAKTNTKVVFPDSPAHDGFTNATFSFWIKPVKPFVDGQFAVVAVKRTSYNSNHAYVMAFNAGAGAPCANEFNFEFGTNGTNFFVNCIDKDANFPIGQWTHVAITYDASASPNVKFYINGVAQTPLQTQNGNAAIYNSTQGLCLGAANGCANAPYNNFILDEFRIYNRTLSAAEILSLYNSARRE